MPTMDEIAKWPVEKRLGHLARGADDLAAAIEGQPWSALVRRPDAKSWAPTEVICHLRDVEALFMERFQLIAAMDDPKLIAPDPDRLAEERQYIRNDPAEALSAFRRRRDETLNYLHGLSPAGWQRAGVHATRGRVAINDFVTIMVWHDPNHVDQIRRGLEGRP